MALEHSYYWQFPLNSDQFNKVISGLIAPGVYEGLLVSPSSYTLAINISPGRCLLPNGTTVWLPGVVDPVTGHERGLINARVLAPGSTMDRIDAVVIQYIHGSDPATNKPTVEVLSGAPAAVPVPPTLNKNQVLLATIYMAAGAQSFSASDIKNVERVVQVSTSNIKYPHPNNTVDTIKYDVINKWRGFSSSTDIKTDTYIQSSMLLMAAKMIMEGIYAGQFSISHTFNTYNKPQQTIINVVAPFTQLGVPVQVTIDYEYYPNQTIKKRIMETQYHKLTEEYTYTNPYSSIPNVTQVIEEKTSI